VVNGALPAYSRARRSAACSLSLSFSHRSSSARERFSRASASARMSAALFACSRSALSSAAFALAVAFSRLSRSFSRAASSRRRSASRRLCSRSKSAAAFLASFSLISGAGRLFGSGRRLFFGLPPGLTAAEVGGQIGVLGEAPVRSRRPLEHHTRLGHRRGDDVGIVRFLGDALMEEIAAGAPRLQRDHQKSSRSLAQLSCVTSDRLFTVLMVLSGIGSIVLMAVAVISF
jgi:hypothetical protein